MADVSVRRGPLPADRFMIVSNDMIRGRFPIPLKVMARCILLHLLSLPAECDLDRETLDAAFVEGREAVSTGLKELRAKGYLRQVKFRREDGSYGWQWHVTDDPTNGFTIDGIPVDGATCGNTMNQQVAPQTGFPSTVNPSTNKKTSSKKTEDLLSGAASAAADEEAGTKVSEVLGRDDVRALCELLQEEMRRNGANPPKRLGKAWGDPARLLLDRDERPLEEALAVLAWSQRDAFWSSNILSMQKFRQQYDKLRLRWLQTAPKQPLSGSRSAVEAWLREMWQAGSAKAVAERSGLRYEAPDVPVDAADPAEWRRQYRRRWIETHREEAITRILATHKETAA